MSTKHTPEPWRAYDRFIILSGDQHPLADLGKTPKSAKKKTANRNRIIACVNACANINPAAVKPMMEALAEWAKIHDLDQKSDPDVTPTDWWREEVEKELRESFTFATTKEKTL